MAVLADVLREASLRGQILVTTQSADLMNELESDELRVVEKIDGVTHIGPVDDEHRKSVEMESVHARRSDSGCVAFGARPANGVSMPAIVPIVEGDGEVAAVPSASSAVCWYDQECCYRSHY